MEPLINGRAYDWAQVVVRMSNGTQPFWAISSISYSDAQEIEKNYGAGAFPVSRGFGNYTTEVSVTLHMEEVERIQASVPSGRLQDVSDFDIVVSFLHPDTEKIVTHKIKNCRFMNNQRELNQNDKAFEVELNIDASHIDWNNSGVLGIDVI